MLNHFSPSALSDVFQRLHPHTTSTVSVSYIEIYKDELRDLLVGVARQEVGRERTVTIREDAQGNVGKSLTSCKH